jgi:hypothetical protein
MRDEERWPRGPNARPLLVRSRREFKGRRARANRRKQLGFGGAPVIVATKLARPPLQRCG